MRGHTLPNGGVMEQKTQKRLDTVLEDELSRGYRIKELPEALSETLERECGVAVTRVRFTRLNPSKRRKISQVVQRQYHKDLQDPDILSHEQILKLVQDRGEWSPAMDKEMSDLQASTSREMGSLFMTGVNQGSWTVDLLDAASAYREAVEAHITDRDKAADVLTRFDRWLEWSKDRTEEYDTTFAASQGRDIYSVDLDFQELTNAVPDLEAIEHLNTIDELRDRLQRYVKLQKERLRLAELQLKHSKIFSDSVEQRRDNAEEMARLYFTTDVIDADGKPMCPLVESFDKLWDFPEPVVQWLLVEAYFFLNGIPDEAREYLQTFGFLAADAGETTSSTGESELSDESPAPPTSKLDSNPAVETDSGSSVSFQATI